MNRPGPLKLGVVERYIKGKRGVKQNKRPWDKYAKDTYGEILYQEQTMLICRKVARMSWEDTDKIMKGKLSDSDKNDYKKKFVNGAVKYSKYSKRMARELFNSMTLYSFNKAHAVAYSLIGFYSMWLYVHHPLPYIYALLRRSTDIDKLKEFEALAIANDIVIWLPHINQSADYTIRKMEDEYIIQKGLSSIKGIGEKTAKIIIENGPYSCEELLVQRVPKRILNSRVLRILREEGCLEFDEDLFSKRVLRYNRKLFSDYEYLRKIDLSKKPKYTNRDYDRLKEDKVFK
jgi:DNA polymerase III subunit alpha